jgi:hypothetical protein
MAILQEIPLQAVINQSVTININNQLIGITIRPITVNNKELWNTTPEYQSTTITFNINADINATAPSSIFLVADIVLNGNPIIYNCMCSNGVYLNPFTSDLVGYLFFYVDDWQTSTDTIEYTNFGDGNTHLYYSDYDALQANFDAFVLNNLQALQVPYVYGSEPT